MSTKELIAGMERAIRQAMTSGQSATIRHRATGRKTNLIKTPQQPERVYHPGTDSMYSASTPDEIYAAAEKMVYYGWEKLA